MKYNIEYNIFEKKNAKKKIEIKINEYLTKV